MILSFARFVGQLLLGVRNNEILFRLYFGNFYCNSFYHLRNYTYICNSNKQFTDVG